LKPDSNHAEADGTGTLGAKEDVDCRHSLATYSSPSRLFPGTDTCDGPAFPQSGALGGTRDCSGRFTRHSEIGDLLPGNGVLGEVNWPQVNLPDWDF
jgi:hypothetical protein